MADEVKTETTEQTQTPSEPKKQNFFKSTSFKCIIVLLAIVLVCGILLTICNALFYVSDAEKLERSLNTIYGTDVTSEYVYEDDLEDLVLEYTNGTIETTTLEVTADDGTTAEKNIVAFKILNYTSSGDAINDYLVKATGTGGYSGGSVTCWIAFTMDENFAEITGVRSVSIDSNVNQSYISKIKSKNLEYFSTEFDGENYDAQLGTGASYSMGAITNAVNTAMEFVNTNFTEPETNNSIFATTLTNIYGKETSYEYIEAASSLTLEYTNGTIETTAIDVTNNDETTTEISVVVFKISEYNDYLIKVKGTGGFYDGSVTCWIAFNMDDDYKNILSVRKVVIDSNVNQSYISKISDDKLDEAFSSYTGSDFDVLLGTGATFTMTAITNAVNTGMSFISSIAGGTV